MNERIKELAEQAGVSFHRSLGATYTYGKLSEILERFAELVRQDEREACAKVCYELDTKYMNSGITGYGRPDGRDCAEAIRQRGEK